MSSRSWNADHIMRALDGAPAWVAIFGSGEARRAHWLEDARADGVNPTDSIVKYASGRARPLAVLSVGKPEAAGNSLAYVRRDTLEIYFFIDSRTPDSFAMVRDARMAVRAALHQLEMPSDDEHTWAFCFWSGTGRPDSFGNALDDAAVGMERYIVQYDPES